MLGAQQHGTWREAMVRRADRHLRFLFEVGAVALGHASILRKPAHLVADGNIARLRITGGADLVQRHRTVVGVAIEEPQRGRER